MNFHELGIEPSILRALKEVGYGQPTPIQRKAIPAALAGRDLLGCAQTGTGKTAAFSIPMLQRMGKPRPGEERPVRGLILTPTRELALQIFENICQYSRYTGRVPAVIYGGVSQVPQVEAIQRGADILIATPGRLWDLMGQKVLDISKVECFVLDEADRMLDMGFIGDVKRIAAHIPKKRQSLLFSATMPDEIAQLAGDLLHKPVRISITPAATPVEQIEQGVYFAEKPEKRMLLQYILRERDIPQTLVFSRTKHGADRIARDLNRVGISARSLHGDKSQGARQAALREFKEYKIAVLVATDIAARGLDISELPLVINFDLPNIPETYVHRIGRTGRAGMEGTALSFCAGDERPYLREIEKLIHLKVPELHLPETMPVASKPTETTEPRPMVRKSAAIPGKRKQPKSAKPRASTGALASRYPRPAQGSRKRGAKHSSNDEFSMDISTPRTHSLSEAAAARVRAKVAAKLAEREARQQAKVTEVKPVSRPAAKGKKQTRQRRPLHTGRRPQGKA